MQHGGALYNAHTKPKLRSYALRHEGSIYIQRFAIHTVIRLKLIAMWDFNLPASLRDRKTDPEIPQSVEFVERDSGTVDIVRDHSMIV